eukprot:1321966-Lingulodinium_polyedra.AAC.1
MDSQAPRVRRGSGARRQSCATGICAGCSRGPAAPARSRTRRRCVGTERGESAPQLLPPGGRRQHEERG